MQPEHLIRVQDGIGILTIRGPLFQRWSVIAWWWGGTSYDVIVVAYERLLADAGVRAIVLDLDTNGGEYSGCFDAVDRLHAARGIKPTVAVVNDAAFSVGYALASTADRIVITRTGGAGSIGVVATHVDVSQWNARVGVAYGYVFAGEKKLDGSPDAPLSDRARAELQAEVDRLYDLFVETVAANRGLDAGAIRVMQAGCYYGPNAVAAGLCDAVGTLESVLADLGAAAIEDHNGEPTVLLDESDGIAKTEMLDGAAGFLAVCELVEDAGSMLLDVLGRRDERFERGETNDLLGLN